MSDNFDLKKYLVENKVTTNSKMLNEGDWNTANNVMAVVNQLLEMGEEGEKTLAILERIPEWLELVSANQDADFAENKATTDSKMMKENIGNFFIDFKSEFANYIQDYIEGGADEEVNVVDTNMGIDKWYQYPKTSVLVNHAVKSLKAAGVDSIEKLYAENNLKYAGESLDEFFQNLKVNETYRGVDFTLIPGVDFSFAEEV